MSLSPLLMLAGESLLLVIPLALSLTVQQWALAAMATALGDDTAKRAGRLTLNPLAHLDWFGTVLLPLCLIALQGGTGVHGLPLLGWAKPAPVRPERMSRRFQTGTLEVLIALCAPLCALGLAVCAALCLAALWRLSPTQEALWTLCVQLIGLNAGLAVFYLLPIGPLSGARLLQAALPSPAKERFAAFNEQYGGWGLLLVILWARPLLLPPVRALSLALLAMAGVGR